MAQELGSAIGISVRTRAGQGVDPETRPDDLDSTFQSSTGRPIKRDVSVEPAGAQAPGDGAEGDVQRRQPLGIPQWPV